MEPKKKILIVEDDEFFRSVLENVVSENNYDVEVAQDGRVAKYISEVKNFDVILSDIRMPEVDGLQLLAWSKEHYPQRKFILMTGFSEILETNEAFELGADGFIPKPFKDQDLFEVLNELFHEGPKAPEEEKPVGPEYCKMSIDDFVSGKEIPYNIFVRLSEHKFVKVAHKGEDISLERIKAYKSKNIIHLYLTREDFKKYVGMGLKIARALAQSEQIPREKKLNFLKHTGEVILERAYVEGVDQESFMEAKDYLDTTLAIISDNDPALSLLQMLNAHGDYLYAHAVGVALYSVMIAREVGWKSSPTVFKVSMGGLYHDIGKKELDPDLLAKPRIQLTIPEKKILESHTNRGMEILSKTPGIPQEVAQLAYEHHEEVTGFGYPRGLTKNKISPVTRLVSVANVFCEYAISGPNNKGMSAGDAITQMVQFKKDGLDPQFFGALKKLFKYKL